MTTNRLGGPQGVFKGVPHMSDPSRTLAVWFTDPPGIVVTFTRSAPFTVALAQWLAGPARAALIERFPGDGPLVFVLDLSEMEGREAMARQVIVEASGELSSRVQRTAVVAPVRAGRIYLASLHVATSLARIVGLTVSIESLPDALRSLRPAG